MLSFDEFHAEQQRERQRKSSGVKKETAKKAKRKPLVNDSSSEPVPSSGTAKAASKAAPSSFSLSWALDRQALGDFVEMHQLQVFTIVLLCLDTFVSFVEVYLSSRPLDGSWPAWATAATAAATPAVTASILKVVIRCLLSFSQFTMTYYLLEMIVIFYAFGSATMSHFGYVLDVLILIAQLYLDISGIGLISRALNMVRLWRVVRVCNSMVAVEADAVERAREALDSERVTRTKTELELQQLREDINREKESNKGLEQMVQSYREEIDTLNEALKIAAMDIAEVAQADEDDEEDDEGDDDLEVEVSDGKKKEKTVATNTDRRSAQSEEDSASAASERFVDAPLSPFDRSSNVDILRRIVQREGASAQSSPTRRRQQPHRQQHQEQRQEFIDRLDDRASTLSSSSSRADGSSVGSRPTYIVNDDGSYRKVA